MLRPLKNAIRPSSLQIQFINNELSQYDHRKKVKPETSFLFIFIYFLFITIIFFKAPQVQKTAK